jgi:hypothetical protein
MNTTEALKLVGGLSKPSKMPGWAYGIPAAECKTGRSCRTCRAQRAKDCYATKGCYVFPVVQAAQYRRLAAIKNPYWVEAMATLIIQKNQNILDGTIPETCRTKLTFLRSSKFVNLHLRPVTGCRPGKLGPLTTWTRYPET